MKTVSILFMLILLPLTNSLAAGELKRSTYSNRGPTKDACLQVPNIARKNITGYCNSGLGGVAYGPRDVSPLKITPAKNWDGKIIGYQCEQVYEYRCFR